jgi:hypothetical protein
MLYLLHPQPKLVNSNKNTIIKNKIVLSLPQPQPLNKLLKRPPQRSLLLHWQPQSLSSGIFFPPFI